VFVKDGRHIRRNHPRHRSKRMYRLRSPLQDPQKEGARHRRERLLRRRECLAELTAVVCEVPTEGESIAEKVGEEQGLLCGYMSEVYYGVWYGSVCVCVCVYVYVCGHTCDL